MTKRERFVEEFNALLQKYKVELAVRERNWAMQVVADGIDFDFNWDEKEGSIKTIECGMCVGQIVE